MISVIKGGMQILSNLSDEERESIKGDLTLDNPVYQQVKNFSRYSYTTVPPYLTYFTNFEEQLIVPRGYEIPFEHEIVRDDRREVRVDYPKFKLKLREAQREAFEAWNETRERGTLVLQTGKGKSILGSFLGYITRQKTLIVVQKNDLVDGWTKDIELCFGMKKKDIGLIKAGKNIIGEQFTIATIQSLNRLSGEDLRELYITFGMVIVDECHHASAKSYEIFKYFQAQYLIGLTATDMRKDNLESIIYWLFGSVVYRSKEDVDDEDIMPYEVIVKASNLKYNPPDMYYYKNEIVDEDTANHLKSLGEKVKRKPLDPQVLRKLLRNEGFNRLVAQDVIYEFTKKKSCLIFIHEKEHIREFNSLLISLGIPKNQIQLYYGDSKETDENMKNRAENKEVLITIATFSKATEGTNVKAWERCFLVTSINDKKNTIQAVGRIRRRKANKPDARVYDYVHPNVKGLRNHIATRREAYSLNKAKVIGDTKPSKGVVVRGFKRA